MNGQQSERRAKVFISCGQRKDTSELEIAHRIEEELSKMGFDPYVAVEEQSLRGLTENIFRQLRESEYLVFVDFKREQLVGSDIEDSPAIFRGSLFSNQELAIAAFLDIDKLLAFQEEGVKKEDGLMKFIQAQCVSFTDRHLLPPVVAYEVQKHRWDPHWKNTLLLERNRTEYDDVSLGSQRTPARYYHISAGNLHRDRVAFNCAAYLKNLLGLRGGKEHRLLDIEFKWKGVTIPTVHIAPQWHRLFDAFYVRHDTPNRAYLGVNTSVIDYSSYIYVLEGPGDFDLTFVVFSEGFAPAEATFRLHIGTKLEDIDFKEVPQASRS